MNVLYDPPCCLTINGRDYRIDTEYRTWIDVCTKLEQMDPYNMQGAQQVLHGIIKTIFPDAINEPYKDIMEAITEFAKGYPGRPIQKQNGGSSGDDTPLFSFAYDINYMILAIRNQSGIDLTHRRKEPFHFWDFLLEFQTLEERHLISKIIAYRAYDGTDKELLKKKALFALPERLSPQAAASLEEMEKQFYDC